MADNPQQTQAQSDTGTSDAQMLAAVQNAVVALNAITNPVANLAEAKIDVSSSGETAVLPIVQGKINRVFGLFFTVSAAVDITIQSNQNELTGPLNFVAPGSYLFLDFRAQPWFTCDQNASFIFNLSGASQISGRLYYTAT